MNQSHCEASACKTRVTVFLNRCGVCKSSADGSRGTALGFKALESYVSWATIEAQMFEDETVQSVLVCSEDNDV